jgi:hypothetical protein
MTDTVPGFGGFFFDDDGNPTVYLRNLGTAAAVDGRLRAAFSMVGSPGVRTQKHIVARSSTAQVDTIFANWPPSGGLRTIYSTTRPLLFHSS